MPSHRCTPLGRLLSKNARFAEELECAEPGFFENSAKGQFPQVLWLGCSDSRVPESVITKSRPGDIFVIRNIANQMHLNDDGALSAVAYGVGTLGVRHVVVVGHSECGGAAASLAAARDTTHESITTDSSLETDPSLDRWLADLTALVRTLHLSDLPTHEALPIVVEENVKLQVANVCNTQTIIDAWSNVDPEKRKVWVHGWVYDLASGRLSDLGISRGPAESTCICKL